MLAGVLGMCSFAPGGPGEGRVPNFDASAALRADAEALRIPVRVPALPEGWRANSGRREGIDGGRTDPATGQAVRAVATRVGYLAPSGMYLSLTQSNADEDALVGSINPDALPDGHPGRRAAGLGGLRGRRGRGAGVDHEARRPGRPGSGRDHRRRWYRRVPYAGAGDSESAAADRPLAQELR